MGSPEVAFVAGWIEKLTDLKTALVSMADAEAAVADATQRRNRIEQEIQEKQTAAEQTGQTLAKVTQALSNQQVALDRLEKEVARLSEARAAEEGRLRAIRLQLAEIGNKIK